MDQSPKIAVLGSINIDLVARCDTLPAAGETLSAHSFAEIPGGKGANQAVAASRAGGDVSMIGRVGDDAFAERLQANLVGDGVDCRAVQSTADSSSGLAMIAVDAKGQNQIVVVAGANGQVTAQDIDRFADVLGSCDALLLQLEVPLETVVRAITIAKSAGIKVILDPAPAPTTEVPDSLFDVDLICPNETEAAALSGCMVAENLASIEAVARELHARGAGAVAITLGDRGVLLFDGRTCSNIDALQVDAVDSTAAGDAFAGALAVRWVETGSLLEAAHWGNAAGALSASRAGAQPSMATRKEIERFAEQVARD